ncbi:hypothetical protein C8Q79DRAFT_920816, partial [Trametes meyenii]
DSTDWSCAYDAPLTILWNLFRDRPDYFNTFQDAPALARLFLDKFPLCIGHENLLVDLRNDIRNALFATQPMLFPRTGPVMTSVTDVVSAILRHEQRGTASGQCNACGFETDTTVDILHSLLWSLPVSVWRPFYSNRSTISASEYVSCLTSGGLTFPCGVCSSLTRIHVSLEDVPPMIFIEASNASVTADLTLDLHLTLCVASMQLAAVVYHGFDHFTCRYLASDGSTWYHDGAHTGAACVRETGFTPSPSALAQCRSRTASHYIFVRV